MQVSDQKPTGHPTVIDIHVDDKNTLDALAEALGATPEEVWATFTFARHILANAEGLVLTPPQLLNAMIGAAASLIKQAGSPVEQAEICQAFMEGLWVSCTAPSARTQGWRLATATSPLVH